MLVTSGAASTMAIMSQVTLAGRPSLRINGDL